MSEAESSCLPSLATRTMTEKIFGKRKPGGCEIGKTLGLHHSANPDIDRGRGAWPDGKCLLAINSRF